MTKTIPPVALLLLCAACGRPAAIDHDDRVMVVAGTLPGGTLKATRSTELSTVITTTQPAPPRDQARQLTVEQSARIRTSEMWSEPITPEG